MEPNYVNLLNSKMQISTFAAKKIELAYAVTERFLSLTLPFSDGTYDHIEDVLCFEPQAIQWEKIFLPTTGKSRINSLKFAEI